MSMTLEQLLAQVAEDNGLTSVRVGRMPVGDRIVWTANVHWDGHANSGIACVQSNSGESIADALNNAIIEAQKDRTPPAVLVAEVPAFEVAA